MSLLKARSKNAVKNLGKKRYWVFAASLLVMMTFTAWGYYQSHSMPAQPAHVNTAKDDSDNSTGISTSSSTSTNSSTINSDAANQNEQVEKPISLDEVQIDKVFVDKSSRTMQLLSDDKVIRSYHIALGDNPKGHKQFEGDERTPEGIYTLDYKNENSIAYRSIHISYPNKRDIAHAKAFGKPPGGAIMIHGQMNGFEALTNYYQQHDWTDGCIAVRNEEMDEIMAAVELGTPIEIVW